MPRVTSHITAIARKGSKTIQVDRHDQFRIGMQICIQPKNMIGVTLKNKVVGFGSLKLDQPLEFDLSVGDTVFESMSGRRRVFRTVDEENGANGDTESSADGPNASDDDSVRSGRHSDYRNSGNKLKFRGPPRNASEIQSFHLHFLEQVQSVWPRADNSVTEFFNEIFSWKQQGNLRTPWTGYSEQAIPLHRSSNPTTA